MNKTKFEVEKTSYRQLVFQSSLVIYFLNGH